MSIVADPTDPTTDPIDPTPPAGGGGTGGGDTTTPATTVRGVSDIFHGQGVEIRVFDKSGNRRRLPALDIADARWTIEPLGGYADFTITVHAEPLDLTNIATGDMVEVWDFGIRQYRGYVSDLTRSEDEPPTLVLAGYGRIMDLERMILQGAYQRPAPVDLSDLFAEIAADIQVRYPNIVVTADVIGVTTQVVDGRQKTAKQVLDTLVAFGSDVAVYGFDADAEGRDRLYLRLIDNSSVDATIAIPGLNVGKRESATHASDVINCVTVQGGTPDYPQLLPNGSFEILVKASNGGTGTNLLLNPSFESGSSGSSTDSWNLSGGASMKKGSIAHKPDARTGDWRAELDTEGEEITNRIDTPVVALVPGHSYEVGAWIAGEDYILASDPPVVTLRIIWRSGGSDMNTNSFTYAAGVSAYRLASTTFICPTGATGFRVELQLTGGTTSSTNQGVMIDDAYVYDVSVMRAASWDVVAFSDAQVQAINWQARGAYDGRNCLYLVASAQDEDDHDIHIQTFPDLQSAVAGGQQIRFSARFKSPDGVTAVPKMFLETHYIRSDGTETGVTKQSFDAGALATWTYRESVTTAPEDAVKAEFYVTIRGSGPLCLDALSARVAASDGSDSDETLGDITYIPAGNLLVTYRADDLISAATNAEVHNSISVYGLRESVQNVSDLTTLTDAKAWATSYLLANAIAYPAPVIDLYDDRRAWAIGQAVRLTGVYGAAYADRVLPVLRINGSISADALMTHSLEIGKLRPTDEELIAKLSLKNAYIALS